MRNASQDEMVHPLRQKTSSCYYAYVINEVRNSGVRVDKITSKTTLTLERIKQYYEQEEGVSFDHDNIVIVNKINEINIDKRTKKC